MRIRFNVELSGDAGQEWEIFDTGGTNDLLKLLWNARLEAGLMEPVLTNDTIDHIRGCRLGLRLRSGGALLFLPHIVFFTLFASHNVWLVAGAEAAKVIMCILAKANMNELLLTQETATRTGLEYGGSALAGAIALGKQLNQFAARMTDNTACIAHGTGSIRGISQAATTYKQRLADGSQCAGAFVEFPWECFCCL